MKAVINHPSTPWFSKLVFHFWRHILDAWWNLGELNNKYERKKNWTDYCSSSGGGVLHNEIIGHEEEISVFFKNPNKEETAINQSRCISKSWNIYFLVSGPINTHHRVKRAIHSSLFFFYRWQIGERERRARAPCLARYEFLGKKTIFFFIMIYEVVRESTRFHHILVYNQSMKFFFFFAQERRNLSGFFFYWPFTTLATKFTSDFNGVSLIDLTFFFTWGRSF